ncbi:MAG: hypothetical protein J4224_05100 [Candidatus Diapherotrites archaeon]|uniref:Uncharacterized protein n=1 Tax=Candidatus Iainarchaeum sp. TaxID=3101447 RepID=A0A7J4IT15_9ARCH|nr:MAG: hypothetical protein QT03_C0001G0991 [archaeon GW2011_AR10]MBS3059769.1 hypothetical protein [Candidatus Diapherotrites archaeon]HIH07960.1 hypothetical protein [Candidatus Diapherotrites archaeon]
MASSKTVAIPKEEYLRLKRHEQIDVELLKSLVRSLEDIKAGRVIRVR